MHNLLVEVLYILHLFCFGHLDIPVSKYFINVLKHTRFKIFSIKFHAELTNNYYLQDERQKDFEELRQLATAKGYFKPSVLFYLAHAASIIGFEVIAYYIFSYFGSGWIPYLLAAICLTTTQVRTFHFQLFNYKNQ